MSKCKTISDTCRQRNFTPPRSADQGLNVSDGDVREPFLPCFTCPLQLATNWTGAHNRAYSLDRKVRTEVSQMYSDPRSHSYEHRATGSLGDAELDIQHQQHLHHTQRLEPEEQQFNYVLNY